MWNLLNLFLQSRYIQTDINGVTSEKTAFAFCVSPRESRCKRVKGQSNDTSDVCAVGGCKRIFLYKTSLHWYVLTELQASQSDEINA